MLSSESRRMESKDLRVSQKDREFRRDIAYRFPCYDKR